MGGRLGEGLTLLVSGKNNYSKSFIYNNLLFSAFQTVRGPFIATRTLFQFWPSLCHAIPVLRDREEEVGSSGFHISFTSTWIIAAQEV